uniref:Uncharacterized protein n=1 Tax=Anopheles minimus TaxID=112268 RepID=A0A182WMT4_9DIPT
MFRRHNAAVAALTIVSSVLVSFCFTVLPQSNVSVGVPSSRLSFALYVRPSVFLIQF